MMISIVPPTLRPPASSHIAHWFSHYGKPITDAGVVYNVKGNTAYNAKLVQSNCLLFNGSSPYAVGDNASTGIFNSGANVPFTFSCWVKLNSARTNPIYVGDPNTTSDQPFELSATSGNLIRTTFRGNDGSSFLRKTTTSTISLSTWYYIEVIYDGGTSFSSFNIYINGVLQSTTNTSSGTYTLIRQITNVNIARTGATRADITIADLKITTTTNVFHVPFSEGNGAIAYNKIGSGLDLTLVNSPTWTTQDNFHFNALNDHWEYSNGSSIIRSPKILTGIEPSGYSLTRAVKGSRYAHNGCETKVNFNPNSEAALSGAPTAYIYGTGTYFKSDGTATDKFKRVESNQESDFLFYSSALTGSNLSLARKFTKQ